ncbi:MAG: ECF transporter S component [Oscillospiraceae bacterium]|nr:ECF transporter S component [Oscillospiraceae bacterium]
MANSNYNGGRAIQKRTLMLTQLGVLTAIVVVLQILAIVTRPLFPVFSISLVLLPITVGAALIGVYAGGWLGLAFGAAVLISGDAAPFLAVNPLGAVLLVLTKGVLAGLAAGFVYKLIADKSKTGAAIAAGAVCPIVNTGVFIIGSYVFFFPTITAWGEGLGFTSGTAYIFFGMVGVNFLVELGLNLVLIPVIVRLIQLGRGSKLES